MPAACRQSRFSPFWWPRPSHPCRPAGPQYRSDEIDIKANSGRNAADKSVKDPSTYATEKQKVDDYFVKAYFPAMTRIGPQEFEKR